MNKGQLFMVGINLQLLPNVLRQEFEYSDSIKENAHLVLKNFFCLSEIVTLYTSNQIEYYYISELEVDPYSLLCYFCPNDAGMSEEIRTKIYYYKGHYVMMHLYKLSYQMLTTENIQPTIMYQINRAVQLFAKNSYDLLNLEELFLLTQKIIKDELRQINLNFINKFISTLSVAYAESVLSSLENSRILIIGTGRTAKLAEHALLEKGYNNITFMSKSEEVVKNWLLISPKPILWIWYLPVVIHDFDVVIACEDCNETIIKKEMLMTEMAFLNNREKVFIDLGVPRNIDTRLEEIPGIHMRNIFSKEIIGEAIKLNSKHEIMKTFFYIFHMNSMKNIMVNLTDQTLNYDSGEEEKINEIKVLSDNNSSAVLNNHFSLNELEVLNQQICI